jgi:hypothetical protein
VIPDELEDIEQERPNTRYSAEKPKRQSLTRVASKKAASLGIMKQFFTRKEHPSVARFARNEARTKALVAPLEEQTRAKLLQEEQMLERRE